MMRRLINVLLLLGGVGLLAWMLRAADIGPRRAAIVVMLVTIGVGLNLIGALRRSLSLRPWLRVLAVCVAGACLAGVLAMYWATQGMLAEAALEQVQLREYLTATLRGLSWVAIALAYTLLSVLVLPRRAPAIGPGDVR